MPPNKRKAPAAQNNTRAFAVTPAPAKAARNAPFRTPQNPFEAGNAAADDVYKIEAIVGIRFVKGARQYQVKWEGYEEKDNTWEPMGNLVGCANEIRAYEKKRGEEDATAKQAALDRRQAAKEKTAAEQLALRANAAAEALDGDGIEGSGDKEGELLRLTVWVTRASGNS